MHLIAFLMAVNAIVGAPVSVHNWKYNEETEREENKVTADKVWNWLFQAYEGRYLITMGTRPNNVENGLIEKGLIKNGLIPNHIYSFVRVSITAVIFTHCLTKC
jgi:hypothetical protein